MRDLGRLLIVTGGLLVVAGLLLTAFGRLGLGKLPGDFVIRRGNFTMYIPLMTSILVSLLLSLLFWALRR